MTICIVVGTVTIIVCISVSQLLQSRIEIQKCEKISRKLLNFLNEADDAYIEGYIKNKIEIFANYATPELCEIVHESMEFNDRKVFGPKEARQREWLLLEEKRNEYKVRKILTHKKIKQGAVSISLGDYIEEIWKVSVDDNSFIVCDIV